MVGGTPEVKETIKRYCREGDPPPPNVKLPYSICQIKYIFKKNIFNYLIQWLRNLLRIQS